MRHLNKDIMTYLEQLEEVEHYSEAGSFRRYKEVSKDLDYIISTTPSSCTTTPFKYSK